MSSVKYQLLSLIERFRHDLMEIVQAKGMTSKEAIDKSQELDTLLNEYNRYKYEESYRQKTN